METKIIDVEEKMRFWIYDAQRTKEFRKKCRQNKLSISEIMKELADAQQLFMIIASSDYIYGTNYQFCHGYVSKDLSDITNINYHE